MTHAKKVLIGAIFGVFYWLAVSLLVVSAGNENKEIYISDLEPKVNYANTITVFKIKAERFEPLRQDAVGLYSQEPYIGQASFYGEAFAGRTTACGDIFNPLLFTAASLRHNCGTRLHVCSVDTGRCVDIVVNDTGGFEKLGRVIDLSEGAFAELAPTSKGLLEVRIEEVEK